jgi:DNA-directed RNA polymerase subunit M/transcription elongation factor TFIIS
MDACTGGHSRRAAMRVRGKKHGPSCGLPHFEENEARRARWICFLTRLDRSDAMAAANVACPKCSDVFRASEDVLGKRIRCPACGFAFTVEKFTDAMAVAKPTAKPKPKKDDDDDADANPFGVKTLDLAPRCPNCANEMESEDAVICLFCGYNTQTRRIGKTKKVRHITGGDRAKWLLPGIACLLGIVVLIITQAAYVLLFGDAMRGKDYWLWNMLCSEPSYLWMTMITCGIIWGMGRFAFKRLILEPTPPEDEIG